MTEPDLNASIDELYNQAKTCKQLEKLDALMPESGYAQQIAEANLMVTKIESMLIEKLSQGIESLNPVLSKNLAYTVEADKVQTSFFRIKDLFLDNNRINELGIRLSFFINMYTPQLIFLNRISPEDGNSHHLVYKAISQALHFAKDPVKQQAVYESLSLYCPDDLQPHIIYQGPNNNAIVTEKLQPFGVSKNGAFNIEVNRNNEDNILNINIAGHNVQMPTNNEQLNAAFGTEPDIDKVNPVLNAIRMILMR